MNWFISETSFNKEMITNNGNKYLSGNGYMGIRGTLQEYEKEHFPAINLAGIYDQVGDGWREPLNAPNPLYTYITVDNITYRLPEVKEKEHVLSLDYRYGILKRKTEWQSEKGKIIVNAERFVSLVEKHLIAMDYTVQVDYDCQITITTGIDGDVWDINGPHYDEIKFEQGNEFNTNNYHMATAITHESKDKVCVIDTVEFYDEMTIEIVKKGLKFLRIITFNAIANKEYHLYKYSSVYTSKDSERFTMDAVETINKVKELGYEKIKKIHKKEWDKKWEISAIEIEGDDEAMNALNYSMYHLHCIAPRHTDSLSIAARGLSGQTYKGAVFWDTEMFMLDFFLHTEPTVAKTLLQYRIDTLDGAKKKAATYGYDGAFYAWESQEGGYDACSDYNVTDVFTKRPMRTYFKDKQVHISSAIVYGIMSYLNYTNNFDLLNQGGAKTIIECAKFYYSLLVKPLSKNRYEIHDVIGPDEYHERVNNNAYTNQMVKMTFQAAVDVMKKIFDLSEKTRNELTTNYNIDDLIQKFEDAVNNIYIPTPNKDNGVIEQFDGYLQLEDATIDEVRSRLLHEKEYWGGAYGVATHTKVIKQADVVTMLTLFSKEYSTYVLKNNLDYYEPRTEHGSSLSACMYALLHCKCNQPDKAYPFFMKSAMADLNDKGKAWAGLIYIGGTHPAAAGGAYMTAVNGFGGFHIKDGKVAAEPKLPSTWKRLIYRVMYDGKVYEINATHNKVDIHIKGVSV